MTSPNKPGASTAIDRTEKKTLLVRIGIAGVLIAALIGALALFEQQPAPAPPQSMKSSGPAQGPPAAPAQNQASGAIAPQSGEPSLKPEPPAEPERTGAPQIAVPADKAAAAKPESDKAPAAAAEDTHPRLVVGKGGDLPAAPKPSPPPAAVAAAPGRSMPAESPPVARAGGGYLVQVGVFSNLGNAEELRKRLVDAGIPAQIEARVQVGPFATQAEASAAQHKLKSLGMAPGMLLSPRR